MSQRVILLTVIEVSQLVTESQSVTAVGHNDQSVITVSVIQSSQPVNLSFSLSFSHSVSFFHPPFFSPSKEREIRKRHSETDKSEREREHRRARGSMQRKRKTESKSEREE